MSSNHFETGHLRYLIDISINQLFDALGSSERLNIDNKNWLSSKRLNYNKSGFLDQLEKNSVYFIEATASTRLAIIDYLQNGVPDLTHDQIEPYVAYIGKGRAMEETSKPVLAYLRGYSQNPPSDYSNWDWDRLRHMRKKKNFENYKQELENICLIYRVASGLADMLLTGWLHDPSLKGIAHTIPLYEMNDTLTQRINFWALFTTGNVEFNVQGKKPQQSSDKMKTRWKFWK